MFTIEYRTFYIQGYTNESRVYIMFGGKKWNFNSVHAAKLKITKFLRIAYGYSTMSEQNKRIYGFK